jgi:tetratricopeptide (TPR) repeat protein
LSVDEARRLAGEGRWEEALALVGDPLARADIYAEQAAFTASEEAREAGARELDRSEATLLLGRGRLLHARFLVEREEDPSELELFERALELARRAGDEPLEAWARFWIGIVHQVCRGDEAAAKPHFDAAHTTACELGDRLLDSYAVRHLGFSHLNQGRLSEAIAALEESVPLRREEGFQPGLAAGLLALAYATAEDGRAEDARSLLAEAESTARTCGATAVLQWVGAAREELG